MLSERFRTIKNAIFSEKIMLQVKHRILTCRANVLRSYFPANTSEQRFEDLLENFNRRVVCGHLSHAGVLVFVGADERIEEAHLCTDCVISVTSQLHKLRPGACETDVQPIVGVMPFEFLGAVNTIFSLYYYRYALFY